MKKIKFLRSSIAVVVPCTVGFRNLFQTFTHGDHEGEEEPSTPETIISPSLPPPCPCEKYNSIVELMYWQERPSRCANESGCEFVGNGITGSCKLIEEAKEEMKEPSTDVSLTETKSSVENNVLSSSSSSYSYPYDGSITMTDTESVSDQPVVPKEGDHQEDVDVSVTSPCDQYNYLTEIYAWPHRRKRCNSESGCKFEGRSVTGTCRMMTTEEMTEAQQKKEQGDIGGAVIMTTGVTDDATTNTSGSTTTDSTKSSSSSGTGGGGDMETHDVDWDDAVLSRYPPSDDGTHSPGLRDLVHDTITSQAVDELKKSQQMANDLAKSLILEVLERKENRGKLGELLQYTFAADTVLTPTRELIYWSLELEQTFKNIVWQVQWHRNYWLGLSSFDGYQSDVALSTIRGGLESETYDDSAGAREYTSAALVSLVDAWLRDRETRNNVIKPLLSWTLRQQDMVITPVAEISAGGVYPYCQDKTVEGILFEISENLKSDDVRKAATDALVTYLTGRAGGNAGSARTNEVKRKTIDGEEEGKSGVDGVVSLAGKSDS